MNSSDTEMKKAGGAFADGLTLVRLFLTPLVMYLIIAKGWPRLDIALLASVLFAIAALTDIFDDMTGGTETSIYRKFGWFDDIADTVLMIGTLIAMLWVFYFTQGSDYLSNGEIIQDVKPAVPMLFVITASIIIVREIFVGLFKGFAMTKVRGQANKLGNIKTAFIMLGTCILLASPWLSSWINGLSGNEDPSTVSRDIAEEVMNNSANVDMSVFGQFVDTSNYVWNFGLAVLWIGAILSVISAVLLFTQNESAANDG